MLDRIVVHNVPDLRKLCGEVNDAAIIFISPLSLTEHYVMVRMRVSAVSEVGGAAEYLKAAAPGSFIFLSSLLRWLETSMI